MGLTMANNFIAPNYYLTLQVGWCQNDDLSFLFCWMKFWFMVVAIDISEISASWSKI